MFKNIENNKKLYNLIFDVMIKGIAVDFSPVHPEIELGSMYGIIAEKNGKVAVANEIFELMTANYLAAKMQLEQPVKNYVLQEDIVENGKFDMELCLKKFGQHFYELYNKNDEEFLESNGRLLFITYLKPLINGQGFYHIETQTRNIRRMDVVVDYGKQQFVVELKLWHGDKKHEDAYLQVSAIKTADTTAIDDIKTSSISQLWEYLDGKGFNEGYLLTFDFRKEEKQTKAEWVEFQGKRIFDVVI
jgi:hypothetical protein